MSCAKRSRCRWDGMYHVQSDDYTGRLKEPFSIDPFHKDLERSTVLYTEPNT
jgi:hypothetical protein